MTKDETFNFDKPLDLNAFDDAKETTEVINNAHVWHEIGHLFAYCLIKRLDLNLGNVTLIKLDSKSSITTDTNFFFLKPGNYNETKDCHGFKNMLFLNDPEDSNLHEKVTDNINLAIAKLIVLISGGLFNIYPFVKKFDKEVFNDCYSNCNNPKIQTDYNGCAGTDWDKSRKIACCLEWSYEKLKQFRFLLFQVIKEYKVFEKIRPIVESTEIITQVEGERLQIMTKKVSDLIDDKLCNEILKLIDNQKN